MKKKGKVVVIMGPTCSGKSKLAIDLATHCPNIEIINADSMQVYHGLDVLTNKVPLHEQKGIPHHLLGTVSPSVEFTAKEFRDSAIPIIDGILSRDCLPVIVGGTNYYIQALVSPFLLIDTAEDFNDSLQNEPPSGDEQNDEGSEFQRNGFNSYDYLKQLDPVAANRVHPNNHRRISQYLSLHARCGILPSKLYQEKAAEYVGQRVDCMIDAGLLGEVYDVYNPHANYSRGLRQAIGVREFDDFLKAYLLEDMIDKASHSKDESLFLVSPNKNKMLKEYTKEILCFSDDDKAKILLAEAIDKVKLNTRRLVRRQKRMLTRLTTLFGWNIHYVDATESILCKSDESWEAQVVRPAVEIIRSFLSGEECSEVASDASDSARIRLIERNLWNQYVCKACGDRVLRGAHEWEQHKQGRGHRKRISRIQKSQQHNLKCSQAERIENLCYEV
ncbi:tRNA dimethylallyltransferase 2 isoform X2 [Mercurialis annua]|uniref:tRNA dimethylallyltransferase 2 isoform X2 n=1 Tax=Mercurialis annua TaxID=3986 RepID=UPI0024AFA476|nr:tRNA dimethylallyltransferase 2 isoform X2 [Mercurialis annua]